MPQIFRIGTYCDENTLLKNYTFSTRKEETRDLATKALCF